MMLDQTSEGNHTHPKLPSDNGGHTNDGHLSSPERALADAVIPPPPSPPGKGKGKEKEETIDPQARIPSKEKGKAKGMGKKTKKIKYKLPDPEIGKDGVLDITNTDLSVAFNIADTERYHIMVRPCRFLHSFPTFYLGIQPWPCIKCIRLKKTCILDHAQGRCVHCTSVKTGCEFTPNRPGKLKPDELETLWDQIRLYLDEMALKGTEDPTQIIVGPYWSEVALVHRAFQPEYFDRSKLRLPEITKHSCPQGLNTKWLLYIRASPSNTPLRILIKKASIPIEPDTSDSDAAKVPDAQSTPGVHLKRKAEDSPPKPSVRGQSTPKQMERKRSRTYEPGSSTALR